MIDEIEEDLFELSLHQDEMSEISYENFSPRDVYPLTVNEINQQPKMFFILLLSWIRIYNCLLILHTIKKLSQLTYLVNKHFSFYGCK